MSRALQRPTPEQIAAADPQASPWVGANAGSGKTRVLTQRVARLLLAGGEPQKILCLTYTKAAAAEMQNRLFAMLGDWAMAPDDWLAEQLALLEGRTPAPAEPRTLAEARRLFARALETPGGLRIQTIHAFCDALLRRFPLESGISPRFEVLDDRQAALMQARIQTELAIEAEAGADPAFDRIAARLNEEDIGGLIAAVQSVRDGFSGDLEGRLEAHFGGDARRSPEEIAADALARLDLREIARIAEALAQHGGKQDQTCAAALGAVAELAAADPLAAAETLIAAYLTGSEKPRSRKSFPVRKALQACPEVGAFTDRMTGWAVETRARLKTARTVARTRDLDAFARRVLERYEAAKSRRALLDFDDLVEKAYDLLVGSDMGAWVLWKLDQGVDHILVDEAQDTSPRQWALVEAIAAEFHAGEGARATDRTLFVVGDEKQSIYSFQGAEPTAFGTTRDRLDAWLGGMGRRLRRPGLQTSFRSAPGILRFVDAVFAGEAAKGLTVAAEPVRHLAHRVRDSARVDLWPLVPPAEKPTEPEWWQPVDRPPPDDPRTRLAGILAEEIKAMIGRPLPPRDGRTGRLLRAGDILVLVTRRDRLAHGLIRRLKSLGVPVAGADRLSLTAQLAVKDLMALIKAVLTPADQLSLAAVLRSPLCGLSEEALFVLAHNRSGTLWQALMDGPVHAPVREMLADLAAYADYLRPYEFLERVLVRHDGRRRLIARLGLEAEDPIDELLAQALAFEARETPSLAGFVDWMEAGRIEVKREMEAGVDAVRVMTVHGAKGLEAPVVILPDTMSREHAGRGPSLHRIGGGNAPLVLWARGKALDDPVTAEARAAAARRQAEERRRLLYVALTRAEDWLILCGAGDPAKADKCWYGLLADGMARLGRAQTVDGPPLLEGPVLRHEDHPVAAVGEPVAEPPAEAARPPATPAWLAPAAVEERPHRVSPSTLWPHEPASAPAAPSRTAAEAMSPEAARARALLRGNAVHLLLEKLADQPPARHPELARRLVAAEFPELDGADAEAVLAEALGVLAAPFAARVFGPGSRAEVPIVLPSPTADGAAMIGRIDRLILDANRALIVDFKSDTDPPPGPEATPAAYLAQLGAYRAGVAALFPDRRVTAAILWTSAPALMELPAHLFEPAAADAAPA